MVCKIIVQKAAKLWSLSTVVEKMKKEIADYIKRLLVKEEPLTDTQAQAIAYWELVDFQRLEDYDNEVFTLV
jgi:hypothetical protein